MKRILRSHIPDMSPMIALKPGYMYQHEPSGKHLRNAIKAMTMVKLYGASQVKCISSRNKREGYYQGHNFTRLGHNRGIKSLSLQRLSKG